MCLIASFRTVRHWLMFVLCVAGFSTTLYSQHMNADDVPCNNHATTVDFSNCLWKAWKTVDRELNAYYQVVSTHVKGGEFEKLRDAERAWIAFRDLNCDAEKELYDGGTAQGPVYNACMEAMTRHRLQELKTMYEWRVTK